VPDFKKLTGCLPACLGDLDIGLSVVPNPLETFSHHQKSEREN